MKERIDWPFDQPRNAAAVSDRAVLAGAPVLLVVHYSDDDGWAFLSGEAFKPANGRVVAMYEVVDRDSTLGVIADLPPGWTARRSEVGGCWVREKDAEV